MILARIEAPHFVAGLVFVSGKCVRAAPILRWCVGKRADSLWPYFALKGWRAAIVPPHRLP